MMSDETLISQKKKQIAIGLCILIILVVGIVAYTSIKSNPYGDSISINGYEKNITDLPKDRQRALNSSLYFVVEMNLPEGSKIKVNDANIRENSSIANFDTSKNLHSGSFIVDIASLKQSYEMSYKWSGQKNNPYLSGYTALTRCIEDESKKVYKDFVCTDPFLVAEKNIDPIIGFLPYSTDHYIVTYTSTASGKGMLNAKIYLFNSDTMGGNRGASISKYKDEIINWIASKNIDPKSYIINYIIED